MAETLDTRVVLHEWGPEDAGKQIGRVTATKESVPINGDENNRLDVVNFDVVVAKIGPDGATYGYTNRVHDGSERRVFFPRDSFGFVAAAGLRGEIHRLTDLDEDDPFHISFSRHETDATNSITKDDPGGEDTGLLEAEQILPKLKEELEQHGFADFYKHAYYTLNAALGHAGARSLTPAAGRKRFLEPLADSSLKDTTQRLLSANQAVVEQLKAQIDFDDDMRQKIFELAVDDVIEEFSASRISVAECEARILEIKEQASQPWLFCLPIGYRPEGRSWPYMDASHESPEDHFGRELACMKEKRNSRVALSEIEREEKELHGRLEFAQAGEAMLQELRAAEQRVVSS